MNPARESALRFVILAGLFLLAVMIGALLWEKIVLPFKNPWGVIGVLTMIGYNPTNDIFRFVAFILIPPLILMLAYMVSRTRLRGLLFNAPPDTERATQAQPGTWVKPAVIAFAVLMAVNSPAIMGEIDTLHEGETLGMSVSHEAGLVPYKDFIFIHGLYQDPLRSLLAFKLFGRSIASTRVLENIHNVLAFTLIGLLAIKLSKGRPLFAFAAVLLPGMAWITNSLYLNLRDYIMPAAVMTSDLTVMSFLIAGISLYRLAEREKPGRAGLFLAAFFYSFIPFASFAYSVDKGYFILAAFIVLTPPVYFFFFRRNRFFLISVILGAVSGASLFILLLRGGTVEFFKYAVLTMPRYTDLVNGFVYPIGAWSAFMACIVFAFNAFWIVKRLLGELNSKGWRDAPGAFIKTHFPELMMFVLSVFLFRTALGRSDDNHLASSLWLPYMLFFYILLRSGTMGLPLAPRLKKAFSVIAVAAIAVVSLSGLYRAYSADLIRHNFPIGVTDEEFIPANYKATISFLKERYSAGETFFTLTNEPIWYYFVNQPSMSRFPFVFAAGPLFYQEDIVDSIERNGVKYVIFWNSNTHSNNIDGINNKSRFPVVSNHIRKNFRLLGWIDDNEMWIRKDASGEVFKSNPAY
ncbi:MAG: hypothetical protein HS130_01445 [Deltaproteobacteria bacterium]|nr:hypothetical protein [Deltaproteobacteria bacterium]MCL4872839.1 hypothetical protein [bacterium]